VRKIAGNGTGDTRWKVPGVLDWNTMTHNPFVDITKDTTTLYASDRDVFLFLVDDTHTTRSTSLPICGCLMPTQRARIGARWRGLCSILIRNLNPLVQEMRSIAISPARNG
jgi:hypothetical protein